jgi:hypothetical protein
MVFAGRKNSAQPRTFGQADTILQSKKITSIETRQQNDADMGARSAVVRHHLLRLVSPENELNPVLFRKNVQRPLSKARTSSRRQTKALKKGAESVEESFGGATRNVILHRNEWDYLEVEHTIMH